MLVIRLLIATLLPDPVWPAINKCGILAISTIMALPVISFPSAIETHDLLLRNSSVSSTSRSVTMETLSFGISTPMADFPGIGASIRTPTAAIANAISSAKANMRLTRVPCSTVSS